MTKTKVMMLADVPVWLLPGLEKLNRRRPYATWLESLVPEFESYDNLDIHWVIFCKEVKRLLIHRCYGQTFHIYPRWKKSIMMLTRYRSEVRIIKRLHQELEPDLIHAWGSEDVYGIAGAEIRTNNPKLFTLQGCLTEYVRKLPQGCMFKLQAWYETKTIRKYKHATAETPQAKNLLLGINSQLQIDIVDYGVDQIFHNILWQPAKMPKLVFVGAITERKGIKEIIEAFSNPKLKQVKIEIVGEGDMRVELEKDSPDNIVWLGCLSRVEVAKRLSNAWCFLMPTYSDTGPTAVKEARVVGLPVITTEEAGANCYIKSGENGYVIPARDTQSIIGAVLNIIYDLNHCKNLGMCEWESTKEKLVSSYTASQFDRIYSNLTQCHSN